MCIILRADLNVGKYCHETGKHWNEGGPFVLFVVFGEKGNLSVSSQLNLFGHNVHGPLKVLKEQFLSSSSPKTNVLHFVSECRKLSCLLRSI